MNVLTNQSAQNQRTHNLGENYLYEMGARFIIVKWGREVVLNLA